MDLGSLFGGPCRLHSSGIILGLLYCSIYYKTDIQPDQINMAVFYWYLVKTDLSSLRYCTRAQITFYKAMFN